MLKKITKKKTTSGSLLDAREVMEVVMEVAHQEKPFSQKLHLGRLVISFAYLNHLRWNFGHLRCNLS